MCSTTLIIESKHNKLIPFDKNIDPSTAEIFVKVFYDANKIVVEIVDLLNKYKKSNNLYADLLDIYITKKGDPDYLINTIEIDPLPLI